MKTEKTNYLFDPVYLTGVLLIVLSILVYWITGGQTETGDTSNYAGIFALNYGLAGLYFLVLLINGFIGFRFPFFRFHGKYIIPLQVLFVISAFSLNRDVCVFEKMVPWVSVILILECTILLVFPFSDKFPRFMHQLMVFVSGLAWPVALYFALFLLPYYPVGIIGSFLLGITLHVFVPLGLLIMISAMIFKIVRRELSFIYTFAAGLMIPIVFVIIFTMRWNNRVNQINYLVNSSLIKESDLPGWVNVSQHLSDDMVFEKIVKSDLIYTVPARTFDFFDFRLPNKNFEEARQHDPLVFTACLFSVTPDLSIEDKCKILESRFDARHQTLDRLWQGRDLKTSNVISNVKIIPEYRLAYTEKIISVKNTRDKRDTWNTQEAIYTFHLPEGGVVTSLSLWMNGREEKGVLTSRSKADTAYKTIVRGERRDPSLVHWQEGNTVSVRVFPCTPGEPRKFKIGMTTPLKKTGNRMTYENIWFDGPPAVNCTETSQILFTMAVSDVKVPAGFEQTSSGYIRNKRYQPYWEIEMDVKTLSTMPFSFDGKNYSAIEYKKSNASFAPETIYLDLNESWTEEEFTQLWSTIQNRRVIVFEDSPVTLTKENHMVIFNEQSKKTYSLFPFYKIVSDNSIVITKGGPVSPQLNELKESDFGLKLVNYFSAPRNFKVFNIGMEATPYIRSLREIRAFGYDQGEVTELISLLNSNEFPQSPETGQRILIHNSAMIISEDTVQAGGSGTDHLMRLFTYNHVLRQINTDFFNPEKISDEIVDEAAKAWVVSPVSSLVVLETQKDYERFNITEKENSLKNASMKGNGAVPEPHEIFLLIMTIVVVTVAWFRNAKG